MTTISVRQSGGANIVSIPKAIISTLGLEVGSKLDLTLENNRIVLTPITEDISLEDLLALSPRACFKVTDDDREWLDTPPVGKEI